MEHGEKQMSAEFESIVGSLDDVNWEDYEQVADRTQEVLKTLGENLPVVIQAARDIRPSIELLGLCEHYDILDKLVLYDGAKFRVRLHMFASGYFDRPHEHRWIYSSALLAGGYKHRLFVRPQELDAETAVDGLELLMVRSEAVGDVYTLGPESIHSVSAEQGTVSLVIRGPAVKERFLVIDRYEKRSWWQYGRSEESVDERERKRMTIARLQGALEDLERRLGCCDQTDSG